MTANKHTPGPWGFLNEKDGEVLLAFGAGTSADLLGTGNWYALWCGIKPQDARLIAAAPELLEALNDALLEMESDWHTKDGEWGPFMPNFGDLEGAISANHETTLQIQKTRAAIAKAGA